MSHWTRCSALVFTSICYETRISARSNPCDLQARLHQDNDVGVPRGDVVHTLLGTFQSCPSLHHAGSSDFTENMPVKAGCQAGHGGSTSSWESRLCSKPAIPPIGSPA